MGIGWEFGDLKQYKSKEQIAESILKPNASISQGFASVQIKTKDNNNYTGFVSQESVDQVVIPRQYWLQGVILGRCRGVALTNLLASPAVQEEVAQNAEEPCPKGGFVGRYAACCQRA